MHLDDAGVVDRGDGTGLVAEASHLLGVLGVLGAEHLDRDRSVEVTVVGEVDPRHATLAEQLPHAVTPGEQVAGADGGRLLPRSGYGRTGHGACSPRWVVSGWPAPTSSSNRYW
ncbi:hypothetical protein AD006_19710 [Pseudonocardia sp. EC080610-09]|nr:hypothetical protein AD006_19710 [Pseudonocardia sp. EC080610-09]ALL84012.1 hypothetical protein AD017_27550 [Pseudonocardia sp. EC080619-01]